MDKWHLAKPFVLACGWEKKRSDAPIFRRPVAALGGKQQHG